MRARLLPSTVALLVATTLLGGCVFVQGIGSSTPGMPSETSVDASGEYVVDGTSEVVTGKSLGATVADRSAVLVRNGGMLTLSDSTVTKSGDSSSSDDSSFYGLNAGILANSTGSAVITGTTVSTAAAGANGVFAYGEGSSIDISSSTVEATGRYAHGIMASGGGTIVATNVDMSTTGANSGVIATDRGGGTITVTGGTVTCSGQDSPGIYSTGKITVTRADITSSGAESAVIEGANSITLTDTALTSSMADRWGVLIYQSTSGDAEGARGTFTMTGGSLSNTASTGALFYVTNSTGVISLSGVDVTAASGTLLNAAAGNWGTNGANGGTAEIAADAQSLEGDLIADELSSVSISLTNGSALVGAVNEADTAGSASVALDATSTWTLVSDSHLSALTGATMSGSQITNIIGHGHTVTYDAVDSANAALDGGTYSLAGGGTLAPE